jgi:hypothetical protein
MPVWMARSESGDKAVGCFDPDATLLALRVAFGADLECDGIDQLAGHAERVARDAGALGIRPDSPVVLVAARDERESRPRYAFRLRVGPGSFVAGRLDRWSVKVVCGTEAEFPEPARSRFVEFLQSLRLGEVRVDELR